MYKLSSDFIEQKLGKQYNIDIVVKALNTIVLCDWYNKDEPAIKGLDFTVLRMVLQKYNNFSRDEFMNNFGYAILFNFFFKEGAYNMLISQKDVEEGKLRNEFEELNRIAIKTLKVYH